MDTIRSLIEDPFLSGIVRLCVLTVIGLLGIVLFSIVADRLMRRRASTHAAQLVRKFIFYTGVTGLVLTLLIELDFDLTGLLATAGIATVAVGFAAQTSLSNLISGLFLIGEKPFRIGDLIRVEGTLGVVESIDLLSIKLRTLDNLFVRIPNENMIKGPVTNITRYPIRRMDIQIGVAYKEDAGRVMQLLKDIARKNPMALDDPEPLILFNEFGDSALQFRFGVWFEKSNYLELRNSLMSDIQSCFNREGIEIPFPHITLYTGSETQPFPLHVASRGTDSQK
jgi:small-conductance mechanosensitive channel